MNDKELEEKIEEFKKKVTFKSVAQCLTGMVVRNSVSAVAVAIVHNLVPDDSLSKKQKIQLYVATWAMSGAAASSSSNWASNRIGEKIEFVTTMKALILNEEKPSEKEKPVQTEVTPTDAESSTE